jgi:hypothetical protein
MTLEELRLIATTLIADKNPAINLPPEQWDILLHFSQLKHYKRKVGLPEEYQPGQPRPSQVYAITQRIDDDLAPFSVHMGRDGELPLAKHCCLLISFILPDCFTNYLILMVR